jgi:hypothetical protein
MIDTESVKAAYASQMLTYADAVTGIAFLQNLALIYKLPEKPFAEMIIRTKTLFLPPSVWITITYAVMTIALFLGSHLLLSPANPTMLKLSFAVEFGRLLIIGISGWLLNRALAYVRTKYEIAPKD